MSKPIKPSKNQGERFSVSSLGPKLSAISVYKTFLKHPEIALTYIPCREYNENYCEGIGDSYESEMQF